MKIAKKKPASDGKKETKMVDQNNTFCPLTKGNCQGERCYPFAEPLAGGIACRLSIGLASLSTIANALLNISSIMASMDSTLEGIHELIEAGALDDDEDFEEYEEYEEGGENEEEEGGPVVISTEGSDVSSELQENVFKEVDVSQDDTKGSDTE